MKSRFISLKAKRNPITKGGFMSEKAGMGGFGGLFGNKLPMNKAQQRHIFSDRKGHMPDTPRNRQLLIELINDPDCKVGSDANGTIWYAKLLPDGSQFWACVRNGTSQNAGRNEKPREWDDQTGFNKNPFKRELT